MWDDKSIFYHWGCLFQSHHIETILREHLSGKEFTEYSLVISRCSLEFSWKIVLILWKTAGTWQILVDIWSTLPSVFNCVVLSLQTCFSSKRSLIISCIVFFMPWSIFHSLSLFSRHSITQSLKNTRCKNYEASIDFIFKWKHFNLPSKQWMWSWCRTHQRYICQQT